MAASRYPDQLYMTGRVGVHEEAINGVYKRMNEKKGDKKNNVRLFYEKDQTKEGAEKEVVGDLDKILLCYGDSAWLMEEKKEKPTKGWMIGWWQDQDSAEAKDGKERRLFVAARCPIAEQGSNTTFLWEVRNEEGDFVSDENTQLVVHANPQAEAAAG